MFWWFVKLIKLLIKSADPANLLNANHQLPTPAAPRRAHDRTCHVSTRLEYASARTPVCLSAFAAPPNSAFAIFSQRFAKSPKSTQVRHLPPCPSPDASPAAVDQTRGSADSTTTQRKWWAAPQTRLKSKRAWKMCSRRLADTRFWLKFDFVLNPFLSKY